MKPILQKAAEILVKAGYARNIDKDFDNHIYNDIYVEFKDGTIELVEPIANTLEGRWQFDAIEDFLVWNHQDLWAISKRRIFVSSEKHTNPHERRSLRIQFCLGNLKA